MMYEFRQCVVINMDKLVNEAIILACHLFLGVMHLSKNQDGCQKNNMATILIKYE